MGKRLRHLNDFVPKGVTPDINLQGNGNPGFFGSEFWGSEGCLQIEEMQLACPCCPELQRAGDAGIGEEWEFAGNQITASAGNLRPFRFAEPPPMRCAAGNRADEEQGLPHAQPLGLPAPVSCSRGTSRDSVDQDF